MSNTEQNNFEKSCDVAIRIVCLLLIVAIMFFGGLWLKQLSDEKQVQQKVDTNVYNYRY